MAPILEIQDLRTEIAMRKSVVRAVDGVSLSVDPGECLGIVGESGSGKTMTALSVMRLLPPGGAVTDGRITLAGTEIHALSEGAMQRIRGNTVGMVFQDPLTSLNPTMTIGDQIAESVRIHRGAGRRQALDRAVEVLAMVGMPRPAERVGSYPHQLSGGMRQRVMIAMALACEPKLLIADEPTTALDVTIQKQILELIDDLRRRLSMAVLLVTHDLGVIAGRADRVAVMYAGRVVETTTTGALFSRPRHPYTEALFAALPEKAVSGTAVSPGTTVSPGNTASSGKLYSIPGQPPDLTAPPPGCKFAPRCRLARDECVAEEPLLVPGPGGSGAYRCFFPVGGPAGAGASVTPRDPGGPDTAPADTAPAEAAASPGAALVRVEHLVKDFAVTKGAILQRRSGTVSAVADVSFTIPAGGTFGLVGESGCGKSTIGRLIVGLDRPTGGQIAFNGHDLARGPGRERRLHLARFVQLMFQDSYASMDPRMRVGTILREPMVIQRDGGRAEQGRRVQAILDEVGLPSTAAQRYPHEFSGGQRQRLGLARALMLRPRMIVADEPVSALDVSIQAQILNLMRDLQREHGLTYLFISHDLSVVRYMADTIGVMYLGKLVEAGPADAVYSSPVHPYTKGLIDTVPVADPEAERAKEHRGVTGELPSALAPPSGCRFRTRCPRAAGICAATEPPLRPYSAGGHQAACHFPLREPEVPPVNGTSRQAAAQ